jgi:hypothetical protein
MPAVAGCQGARAPPASLKEAAGGAREIETASAQAGRRSYMPCTSAAWKRATWLVGGSASA